MSSSDGRSTLTIASACRRRRSGTRSRTSTPVARVTTSKRDSTCWMFTVVITEIPAARISSTSWNRFSCSTPGTFVCASSSTRTISGLRARIPGRSISSISLPLYATRRRGSIGSPSSFSRVSTRPCVSTNPTTTSTPRFFRREASSSIW
ncbi:MAG TPA: hypothetical protein VFS34_06490 [Thermoanaerobaculia bacterium]|nr:hypothetical protein [Thermoanaerobaculia bacterium]